MITTFTSSFGRSFLLLVTIIVSSNALNDKLNVAPGYYAFETASRRHGQPPRVRPPPYYSSDLPCPGVIKSGIMYSPKDTLCGDLNKGFIPRNPMGHMIHNQPYPFEIIKNKTLHFLAKALPFLKEDIDSIPKVVKLSKDRSHGPQGLNSNLHEVPFPQQDPYLSMAAARKKRSSVTSSESVPTSKLVEEERKPKFMSTVLDSLTAASGSSGGSNSGDGSVQSGSNWDSGNITSTLASLLPPLGSESRQKPCESKDGIMCQVMQSLGSGSLLGTINQAAQVIQAAQSLGTIGQGTLSLANLVQQLSQGSNSGSGTNSQKTQSGLSQLMTLLEDPPKTVHGTTSSASSDASSSIATGSSNFSPILAVLDYLASNSNEKSAISSLLPARRKKPMDLEELASEAVAAVGGASGSAVGAVSSSIMANGAHGMNRVPPTPCPSLEEYIAPVFARNYQGVWKYIVQIPHEGYFTQTVQKTSCIKAKCDFMDGSCHESPRWVSLLVAEIFYPDARFPNPVPPAPSNLHLSAESASYPGSKIQQFQSIVNGQSMVNGPQMVGPDHQYLQPQQHKPQLQYQAQQMQPGMVQMGPQSAHQQMHNLQVNLNPMGQQGMSQQQQSQQHFRPVANWRAAGDEMSLPNSGRRMQRQMNENDFDKKENGLNNSGETSKESSSSSEPECDGVDKVGCYLIRVYYDWFLVPGSCKCWKKNSQGSLDTLKKIFIGK